MVLGSRASTIGLPRSLHSMLQVDEHILSTGWFNQHLANEMRRMRNVAKFVVFTLHEANIAPENGWLEDYSIFLLGWHWDGFLVGAMLVSGSVQVVSGR